jgi:hypothetical protein
MDFLAMAVRDARLTFNSTKGVMTSAHDRMLMSRLRSEIGDAAVAGGSASGESHAEESIWIEMPGAGPEFQEQQSGGGPSRGAEEA